MSTSLTITNGETLTTSGTSSGTIATIINGATSSTVTITSGTTIEVQSGAVVSNFAVGNGVELDLDAGGIASSIGVASNALFNEIGTTPVATNVHVSAGGIIELATANAVQSSPVAIDSGAIFAAGAINTVQSATATGETLTVTGNGVSQTIVFNQPVTISNSGSVGIFTIACFAEGTDILTEAGNRPVEAIQPGDLVAVRRGNDICMEPAKWIGRARVDLSHHAHVELAAPIRVKAGALAPNVPTRDMLLSPEHCLVLDGRCVPVKLLVNGASIAREHPDHPFHYYHVELERHGVLIAEGADSESYLDTGNRSIFDNAGTPRQLHPIFDVNPNADRWQTEACAPLATEPHDVAPIWQRLAERATTLGLAIPTPLMTGDPDLHLLVDGKRITPTAQRNQRITFVVPARARSVTLASRFCIPADQHMPGIHDTRRLGINVRSIAIRTSTDEIVLPADHPSLHTGWNAVEVAGKSIFRWTNGAAAIPWDGIKDSAVVTIHCNPLDLYPTYDKKLRFAA